jgi:TetR/AcrR family transcriptional regulator, tetracycline repressor protein
MAKELSRLDRLKAAAKAHAAAERQRLEERAKAGDERSAALLAKIQNRDELIRDRIERTRERQMQKQRAVEERIQRHLARRGKAQRRSGRLQRDDVVAAALDLLADTGLDGMTLRDVAARLSIQAPALYWHFANKRDMVEAMAEALLADFVAALELPDDPADWRAWLRQTGHGLREAMLARPDGARIVAGSGVGGSRVLSDLVDEVLRALQAAGFDPVTASAGARTVINYTLGAVMEEQAGARADQRGDKGEKEAEGDEGDSPSIARSIDAELRLSPAAQFDLGLELVLRGLEARR